MASVEKSWDLLGSFNYWFTFFVKLIERLLPSIINDDKLGWKTSTRETVQYKTKSSLTLSNFATYHTSRWSYLTIEYTPLNALFYSLWTHFSVKGIPSAPSKPVKMCRDLLVFKMTESSFVFLQYPMKLEIKWKCNMSSVLTSNMVK